MSSSSLLGDLSKRVSRFGKSPKTVPGTYMSAAGIQSEIHPTTLARLAVHETMYRRQVHVYRQDLANTVYTIRRDQRMLRKSVEEYTRKQRLNKANKYVPSFIDFTSKTQEVDPKKVPEKKVRISLPPLDVLPVQEFSDSKFMTDSRDTFHSEGASSERVLDTIDENDIDDDENVSNEQSDLNQSEDYVSTGDEKINNQSQSKDSFDSSILDGNVDLTTKVASNGDLQDSATSTAWGSNNDPFPNKEFHFKKPHKPHQSETSSFMELVRMKNKSGLTKNLKVIDKLVSESRNRRFAYLTKVTTIHEDQVDSASKTRRVAKKSGVVDLPQIKLTFDNNVSGDSNYKIHNQDSLDNFSVQGKTINENGNNPLPPIPVDTNENELELNKRRQDIVVVAKQQDSLQVTNNDVSRSRSRRLSIPARQLDKFLLNEKIKTENYKDDITWQQSLASIKDVHYIRNRNDYEEFALKVLQDAETTLKPL